MSLREAATLPGVSIYTVRRLIGAGQVKSVRISNREIWVKQRQIRDLLLAIEPGAKWEKHEARRCPRCRRWFLGIQAQMLREREVVARLNGKPLEPCGESCRLPAERRRHLKLALEPSAPI